METRGNLQSILDTVPEGRAPRAAKSPDREFVVLFSARTGSSHLSELLTSAQIGDVREWLNPGFLHGQATFFGTRTFRDYFLAIRSVCPGGLFGQKMTVWFYEAFARESAIDDFFRFDVPSVLLFRENIIEQAVSLRMANHRRLFHRTTDLNLGELSAVKYEAQEIGRYAMFLFQEELRLKAFCEKKNVAPKFLSYEQLIARDHRQVIEAIAHLIGVTAATLSMNSRHQKLGNHENLAHARRFMEENLMFCQMLGEHRRWLAEALQQNPLLA